MADFSFVKDGAGRIEGVWVQSPDNARDRAYVTTLFVRGGLSGAAIAGEFRVVPNRLDDEGGCFVMLGSHSAPGEGGKQPSESFGVTEIVLVAVPGLVVAVGLFMAIYRAFVPPTPAEPIPIAPQMGTDQGPPPTPPVTPTKPPT